MNNSLKKCLSFLFAFITYLSFIQMDIIVSYNVLSFIVFILLLLLYKNYLFKNDKYKITSIVLASIFFCFNDFWKKFLCLL